MKLNLTQKKEDTKTLLIVKAHINFIIDMIKKLDEKQKHIHSSNRFIINELETCLFFIDRRLNGDYDDVYRIKK